MIALCYSKSAMADAKKISEEIFSTSVILADSETISLGVGNFDPKVLLDPKQAHLFNKLTNSESIDQRNQLSVTNLPYTFVLNKNDQEWSDKITASFSYIKQSNTQSVISSSGEVLDENTDKVYSGYLAYSTYMPLSKRWKMRLRMGSYLMHHDNDYQYNNANSLYFQPQLDGIYYNLDENALIIEPNIQFTYTKPKTWGKWQFSSQLDYFIGKTFSGASSTKGAKPQGWRINNKVKLHYSLSHYSTHAESVYIKLQRSDISGDMVSSLNTHHFYEIGVGILIDTTKLTDLADNIGIGINLNKGSSLYGGSVVFYFNEF
jgi:hypothetical protein